MDYGYQQLSRMRTAELRAEADNFRLAKRVAEADDGRSRHRPLRSVVAVLVLSLMLVLGLSSMAFARPAKHEPFFQRSGRASTTEVTEPSTQAASEESSDLPLLIGAGLLVAAGAAVTVSRRPRTA